MPLSQARRPSYEGTETTSWDDVAKSMTNFVDGYYDHTDASRPDDPAEEVADLPQNARSWIASKTLLGDPDAETVDELISFPVVNPNTNALNAGAVRNAISRAPQADISASTVESVQAMGRTLLDEEFDTDEPEEDSRHEEESGGKANPDDLSEGTRVRWDAGPGLAYGEIDTVETNGTVEARPEGPTMDGTPDNPAFLVQVYEPGDEGWVGTETFVVHRADTLAVIDDFPQSGRSGKDVAGVDTTPTQRMADAAQRGLEMAEEGMGGDGLTAGTKRRAQRIADRESLTRDEVMKGSSFWGRNDNYCNEGASDAQRTSANLWGGCADAPEWYARKSDEIMEAEAEESDDSARRAARRWRGKQVENIDTTPTPVMARNARSGLEMLRGGMDRGQHTDAQKAFADRIANRVALTRDEIKMGAQFWRSRAVYCDPNASAMRRISARLYGGCGAGSDWFPRKWNRIRSAEKAETKTDESANAFPYAVIEDTPNLKVMPAQLPYQTKDTGMGPGSIKDVDVGGRMVTGYYAAFGNVDADGDVFKQGAFQKSIKRDGPGAKNQRIKHLNQHQTHQPLGLPHVLKEDSQGLYFETKIIDTALGRDVLKLYEANVFEHSVGFFQRDSREMEDGNTLITEAELFEGSNVTWGANAETPFTGFKAGMQVDVSKARELASNLRAVLRSGLTEATAEQVDLGLRQLEAALSEQDTDESDEEIKVSGWDFFDLEKAQRDHESRSRFFPTH